MTTVKDRDATDVALIEAPQGASAYALFSAETPDQAHAVLSLVRAKIDAFLASPPDAGSEAGRAAIKSFAHKVTKSKTALEEVGERLAAEQKKIPKRIDATRKLFRDTLDKWRDEVRKPVSAWEAAEDARVNGIKAQLSEMQDIIDDRSEHASQWLLDTLGDVELIDTSEKKFAEYASAAAELKARSIDVLIDRIAHAQKREADAAELVRLRKEAEERARNDRDEQIAREAADRATEAAVLRESELRAAAERAERDKIEAQQRAERAEQEARARVLREAKEIADREAAEQAKREADRAHKAKINRDAFNALVDNGLPEDIAKIVVKLIASRSIPRVIIQY